MNDTSGLTPAAYDAITHLLRAFVLTVQTFDSMPAEDQSAEALLAAFRHHLQEAEQQAPPRDKRQLVAIRKALAFEIQRVYGKDFDESVH